MSSLSMTSPLRALPNAVASGPSLPTLTLRGSDGSARRFLSMKSSIFGRTMLGGCHDALLRLCKREKQSSYGS